MLGFRRRAAAANALFAARATRRAVKEFEKTPINATCIPNRRFDFEMEQSPFWNGRLTTPKVKRVPYYMFELQYLVRQLLNTALWQNAPLKWMQEILTKGAIKNTQQNTTKAN